MRKLLPSIVWISAIIFLSGCAVGYMSSHAYDPRTREETTTAYSPLFSSVSLPLAEGVEFRVSVVNTRRVEPVSYSLLRSIGGLSSEDMESKATAVVHFKNDSKRTYRVRLRKVTILAKGYDVKTPEIVLRPGERFDTRQIAVIVPTYNTVFELNLYYELNGQPLIQSFSMRRQTLEELRNR